MKSLHLSVMAMLLSITFAVFFTSCAKEEITENEIVAETELTIEIPRGMSEEQAIEWMNGLSPEEAQSHAVEPSTESSLRGCFSWSSWRTYSTYSSCSGCSGYAKARHTLRQYRTRLCCNNYGNCFGQYSYRTQYVCRTYC